MSNPEGSPQGCGWLILGVIAIALIAVLAMSGNLR